MRGFTPHIPPLSHQVIRDEVLPHILQPSISSICGYSRWALVNAQLWWYDISMPRRGTLTSRENALKHAFSAGKFLMMNPRLGAYYRQHPAVSPFLDNSTQRRGAKLRHRQPLHHNEDKEKYLSDKQTRLCEEAQRQCGERGWLVDERARLAQKENRLRDWEGRLYHQQKHLEREEKKLRLLHLHVGNPIYSYNESSSEQSVNDIKTPPFDFNNYRCDLPNPFGNSMK
ncbi:hypothetical protein P154DRAFT_579169 [Amniculicola lignicola CBS 123094]|uniref:Uncharacterized protein n=1 Tax=Amniculicola lignicola CBS 123094 TaxID=1392246 RepID=A0A6A5WHU7_9PLEO|nr:hypothetical protein P154DRAFT_579169 [Amniculicola lignicola CBS 123094]